MATRDVRRTISLWEVINMAKYVDGFVFVVPNDKTEEYKKMAEEGRDSWIKNGALSYYECKGDDMVTKDQGGQKQLEFPQLTKAEPNETVWFSFITFNSKEHRDQVNNKVMEEMSEKYKDAKDFTMPFDINKMAYGGFTVEVEG